MPTKNSVGLESSLYPINLNKDRIASHCVCCASNRLNKSPAVLMPFISHRVFDWQPLEIDQSWGLESLKTGFAYSICNSLFCIDCGLLFLDIRFSDAELNRLYDDYRGDAYTALREFYEPDYQQKKTYLDLDLNYIADVEAFIAPFIKTPVSILDWGGDTGQNTPYKNNCTEFDVFDLSGKDLISGATAISREVALSKKYDLVVCSHVLEHVPYPSELLLDIKNTMDEDSVLYIEVPLEDVMKYYPDECLRHKRHWHEHINFYSKKSLKHLIENCGFYVIKMEIMDVKMPLNCESKVIKSTLMQVLCKLKT